MEFILDFIEWVLEGIAIMIKGIFNLFYNITHDEGMKTLIFTTLIGAVLICVALLTKGYVESHKGITEAEPVIAEEHYTVEQKFTIESAVPKIIDSIDIEKLISKIN